MSSAGGQRIVQAAQPGQKGLPQGATIVKLVNAQGQPVGQLAKPGGAVKAFAPGGVGAARQGVQVQGVGSVGGVGGVGGKQTIVINKPGGQQVAAGGQQVGLLADSNH